MPQDNLTERLPRHLKMRELRILLAVAEQGSFRKAGQALHVSQPAITSAIAELEHLIGLKLIDRTPQGVIPTTHGASFIRRADAIFGELNLAAEEIEMISSGAQGTLHMGTVPMPASGILPAALEGLLAQFPRAFVSVLEASEQVLGEALKTRKIDLFIARRPRQEDRDFHYETLFEDSVVVIAHRDHPLANRKRIRYDDLREARWIIPPPGSFFFGHIERVLGSVGYEMPKHAIESISIPVMYGMLAHGGFLAFATRSQYEFTPMRPLLATLPLRLPQITAPIGLVTIAGRQLNPLGARLVDRVRELIAGLGASR